MGRSLVYDIELLLLLYIVSTSKCEHKQQWPAEAAVFLLDTTPSGQIIFTEVYVS